MRIDVTKPVETRCGLPARIICTDSKTPGGPLAVLIAQGPGREILRSYTMEGVGYRTYQPHPVGGKMDLINVRNKVPRWKVSFARNFTWGKKSYAYYKTSAGALHVWSNDGTKDRPELDRRVTSIALVEVYEDELGDDE